MPRVAAGTRTTKTRAVWVKCAGYDPANPLAHDMRDGCTTCAPWWEDVPLCPLHRTKLRQSGYCVKCRKFYDLRREVACGQAVAR